MSRAKKVVLGIVSIGWPIPYFFVLIVLMRSFPHWRYTLLFLNLITIPLLWALVFYFVFHVIKDPRMPKNKKVVWVLALFLFNFIALPFYWYFYIWRPGTIEASA